MDLPEAPTFRTRKLQFVISGELGVIFDLDAISIPRWVGGRLVPSVAGGCGADEGWGRIFGIIKPDDGAFPFVAVAAGDVASVGLIFWPVPRS